jgi:hypothetical protein
MRKRTVYLAVAGGIPSLVSGLGVAASAPNPLYLLIGACLVLTSVLGVVSLVRAWTLIATLASLMLALGALCIFFLMPALSPVMLLCAGVFLLSARELPGYALSLRVTYVRYSIGGLAALGLLVVLARAIYASLAPGEKFLGPIWGFSILWLLPLLWLIVIAWWPERALAEAGD